MRGFLFLEATQMTQLPSAESFVGSGVTESGFKAAQTQLIEYIGVLNGKVEANGAGHYGVDTYATANAIKGSLPAGTIIEVMNDPDITKNGSYTWNGTTLTLSGYDPYQRSKSYTDKQAPIYAENAVLKGTESLYKTDSNNLYEFPDANGNIPLIVDEMGNVIGADFQTEDGSLSSIAKMVIYLDIPGVAIAFADEEFNILSVIREDGTVVHSIEPTTYGISEIRSGMASNEVVNDIATAFDQDLVATDTPLKFSVTVSPFQADGTRHQRMASAIKTGPNRLYVAFTQFSTMSTDQADGRLVGRFVEFDLKSQTASVSETIPIIGEQYGNNYRHPHFIQLRDRILMIFNGAINELFVYESFDNCETWQLKTMIDCPPDQPWALAIDSAVLIEDGRYKGRIVLALFRYQADGLVGTVYSDDSGKTWIRGQNIYGSQLFPNYPIINETSVALDSQQNLIFVIRNEGTSPESRYLIFAKSTDGGKTLQIFEQMQRTPALACQTGLKQTSPLIFDGMPRIIATCPTSGGGNRESFRFRISYDNCMSWAHEYKPFADTLRVGYSTLIPLDQKTYALVYEEGTMNASQSIKITFLNLAEVL